MHIHLDSYVGARPNFADAPLYLSYGITTVLNLRGLPEHLEWRRRIQDGELLAPTLYTAGEFINEPRVRTPDEVEREVIRQFRAGYDVLKYHPIVDTQTGRDISTEGLQAPAFARMMETARRLGIPVIGHAPASLPLRIVLQEHESLAHMNRRSKAHIARSATTSGEFVHVYFFPLGLFILSLLGWSMASAIEYVRKRATTRFSFHRFRSVSLIFAATALLSLGLSVALILSGNVPLLALDTLLVLGLGVLAVAMTALGVRAWRLKDGPVLANLTLTVISLAGVTFFGCMGHWIPILWRSSDIGINRVAKSTRTAGIWVEPTLVLYDSLSLTSQQRALLLNERAFKAMPSPVRQRWQQLVTVPILAPWEEVVFRNFPSLTQRLTRALHEARVPLMAGTDAPGGLRSKHPALRCTVS